MALPAGLSTIPIIQHGAGEEQRGPSLSDLTACFHDVLGLNSDPR